MADDIMTRLRRHTNIANCNGCMICTAADEIEQLNNEAEEDDQLRQRMSSILHATANALHGGPRPALGLHSWHNLSDLAKELRSALAIAAGIISTLPEYENRHPEDVFNMLLEMARNDQ